MRLATPSSVRFAVAIAGVVGCGVIAVIGLATGTAWLAWAGLAGAVAAAGAVAFLLLLLAERRRHEAAEGELAATASFLDSLVESMGTIAQAHDAGEILEQTRRQAERIFDARAQILAGASPEAEPGEHAVAFPLRVRGNEIGSLRLSRNRPFDRGDVARATVLADFAAREADNARLLEEAKVREADRARLSEQLVTAEQDERRRVALFLHDGPVQSMAGIGLMLDATVDSIESERLDDAKRVLASALERHRETIRSLRDLSFNIEPVVLRDQGFGPAVRAFAERVGLSNQVQIELELEAADNLAEKAQVGLYQIIRETVDQAIRRGPPTRISIRVEQQNGEIATEISDDGTGERRRRSFEAIEERARTLNGRVSVGAGANGGTAVRVVLPAYAAESGS